MGKIAERSRTGKKLPLYKYSVFWRATSSRLST